MKPPTPARMWETFLKIAEHAPNRDPNEEVVYADPAAKREETLAYLRVLREQVLPFVHSLEDDGIIDWYAFLLHDRTGGVPVPENDRSVYVHLRFCTVDDSIFTNASPWVLTRRMPEVDVTDDDMWSWYLLGRQSEMVLEIVEHSKNDDDMVNKLAGMLHYFSNMTQMRVQ